MKTRICTGILLSLATLTVAKAHAETNPNCQVNWNGHLKRVHVWYTFSNTDQKYSWYLQIAKVFENNIAFVDENCNFLDTDQKIELSMNSSKKVGMAVLEEKAFNSIYSFIGIRNDENLRIVPNKKTACLFVIAPYGPGQMDRTDWKLNNADCVATDYGTKIQFK